MTVTFLDPAAEEGVDAEPYELFADTSQPLRLALIANSFPDGTRFMDKLEEVLAELLPTATLRRYQKPNVAPVTEEQIEAITEECDAVVSAWGH
jgi:hypothetical protein